MDRNPLSLAGSTLSTNGHGGGGGGGDGGSGAGLGGHLGVGGEARKGTGLAERGNRNDIELSGSTLPQLDTHSMGGGGLSQAGGNGGLQALLTSLA